MFKTKRYPISLVLFILFSSFFSKISFAKEKSLTPGPQTEGIIKKCVQNFSNVRAGGDIIMNCITTIETLSTSERNAIYSISVKLSEIAADIKVLELSKNKNREGSQEEIRKNKKLMIKLNSEYLIHKKIALRISKAVSALKKQLFNIDGIIKRGSTTGKIENLKINEKLSALKVQLLEVDRISSTNSHENSKISAEISALINKISETSLISSINKDDNLKTNEDVSILRRQITSNSSALRKNIGALERQTRNLEGSNAQIDRDVSKVEAKIQIARKKIADLKLSGLHTIGQVQRLGGEIDQAKKERARFESSIQIAQKKIIGLKLSGLRTMGQVQRLNREIDQAKKERVRFGSSIQIAQKKIANLKLSDLRMMGQIQKLDGEIDQAKKERAKFELARVAINKNIQLIKNGMSLAKEERIRLEETDKGTIKRVFYLEKKAAESSTNISRIRKSAAFHQKQIYETFSRMESFNDETVLLLDELGVSISENTNSIVVLEDKVYLIENDLGYLMSEYTLGNLKRISFYGPKLGILSLDGNPYNYLGLEFERLLDPKYNLSLHLGLSRFSGKKENKYLTLSGIDEQVIEEDISFYGLDLGVRKFFRKNNKYNFYAGASVGYAMGDEETLYASASLGMESYKKYNKLSIELGYYFFDKISYKDVSFNPLGQALIADSHKNLSGFGLNLKYSTR